MPEKRPRHSTTIDIAVIGQLVQLACRMIDGIYEAQLEDVQPTAKEGKANDQADGQTRFADDSTLTLTIAMTPFISTPIAPLAEELRARVIERVEAITGLRVDAVHIHVPSLRHD